MVSGAISAEFAVAAQTCSRRSKLTLRYVLFHFPSPFGSLLEFLDGLRLPSCLIVKDR